MAPLPLEQQQAIKERIRQLIALLGLSQGKFAQRLGISAANMSKHLSGRLPITNGLVNRICLDYGVSRQWLLNGEDLPFGKNEGDNARQINETVEVEQAHRGVPVYDIDVTAGFGPLDRIFTDEKICGFMDIPQLKNPRNERVVRVSGSSMEPVIQNGAYVAIRETPSDTIHWGNTYVVILEDYRMVKIIRKHPEPEKIILHSENPRYDDMEIERSKVIGLYLVDAVINFTSA